MLCERWECFSFYDRFFSPAEVVFVVLKSVFQGFAVRVSAVHGLLIGLFFLQSVSTAVLHLAPGR